jgi:hypothetical protein
MIDHCHFIILCGHHALSSCHPEQPAQAGGPASPALAAEGTRVSSVRRQPPSVHKAMKSGARTPVYAHRRSWSAQEPAAEPAMAPRAAVPVATAWARSSTWPATRSMPVRRLPSCRVFATNVSSDAMMDNHGGGPGHGQRGQMSSLSINDAIDASAAAMIRCAADLSDMYSAAIFELAADTRNPTDHGTGSGSVRSSCSCLG